MASFRILDQCPQYRKADGTLCAGGSLNYFENESTTPKNVTDGPDGVSLGAVVTLGADARPEDNKDPWGDGVYRVVLKDSDGATVYTMDDVQGTGTDAVAPLDPADGTEDQVYSTDGVDALWRTIREVPDPTGQSGKYLGTDGEALSWTAFPEAAEAPGLSTNPGSKRRWTDGILEQWGSDTAPTAAALTTSKAVTFPTAFDSAVEHVDISPVLSGGVTSNSPSGRPNTSYSSPATTGFTAHFFVGEENNGGTDTITSTIPFTWRAIGPCAVDPDA